LLEFKLEKAPRRRRTERRQTPAPRPGSQGAWLEDAVFGIAQTRDEEHDFPPGQWEVVATATNTAGEGPISNTLTVVVA